jgi:hypothetical protein
LHTPPNFSSQPPFREGLHPPLQTVGPTTFFSHLLPIRVLGPSAVPAKTPQWRHSWHRKRASTGAATRARAEAMAATEPAPPPGSLSLVEDITADEPAPPRESSFPRRGRPVRSSCHHSLGCRGSSVPSMEVSHWWGPRLACRRWSDLSCVPTGL